MIVRLVHQNEITENLQSQLSELYLQLNSELEQLPLATILAVPENLDVAICLEDKTLIGIAMMAKYKVVSGYKGMIEDVVVSQDHRGKGIGRKLMDLLMQRAKECELDDVLLFSGHHRTAAIALYKSLGFTLKNSGLYVKKMKA